MWLIWLRFMWKFISSVESMVVLSLVIFEKMSSNQVSKYRFWQEKYYYLSTLNLLQNRNPNASLPIHSFLLNLKQFYRLYLWSLFVFLFVWVFWEEERMLVVFFSCLFGLSWVGNPSGNFKGILVFSLAISFGVILLCWADFGSFYPILKRVRARAW